MKRIGNLYEKIVNLSNIKASFYSASRTKKNHRDVRMAIENIDYFSRQILLDFHISGKYIKKAHIDESSGKHRDLLVPPFFPDQIIQHAVVDVINPCIEKKLIPECCCSRVGKGILYASKIVRKYQRRGFKYYVKFDIHKYFPSINHDILKAQLRRIFKEDKVLSILDEIIDSVPQGIAIGNYTSQSLANLYLTPLDRFIKQDLRIKGYVRYMDDFIIMGKNKRKLKNAIPLIVDFIEKNLKLETHHHELVENSDEHPIDFCGYRHDKEKTRIRKRIWCKARRMLIRQAKHQDKSRAKRFMSYLGYILHSDSFNIRKRFEDTILRSHDLLSERRKGKWLNMNYLKTVQI